MPDLPSTAALSKRSTKALLRTLRRFGIVLDAAAIESNVAAVVSQLTAAGVPSQALIQRTEAAVIRASRVVMIREIKDYVRRKQREGLGLTGRGGGKAVWVAVLDSRTCPDCLARHGVKKTMADWEREGLPGSDNLICDGNCRCDLLRADMVDEDTTRGEIRVSIDIEVSE